MKIRNKENDLKARDYFSYVLHQHLIRIACDAMELGQQLTELLIKNEWSVKQTEEICKAVRDDIPEYLHEILPSDKYIKELIKEASKDIEITVPKKVANWVKDID